MGHLAHARVGRRMDHSADGAPHALRDPGPIRPRGLDAAAAARRLPMEYAPTVLRPGRTLPAHSGDGEVASAQVVLITRAHIAGDIDGGLRQAAPFSNNVPGFAAAGPMARGQLRIQQCGREPMCRAAADRASNPSSARAAAPVGLRGGGGSSRAPTNGRAIAARCATRGLNKSRSRADLEHGGHNAAVVRQVGAERRLRKGAG
jgi:hypothetical protein